MRILHVIPSLAEAHGGPTRAMGLIERALGTQGLRIDVATTDDDGSGGRLELPVAPANDSGSTRRYFRKTTNFYKSSFALARWLSAHVRDYDVVHIHALFSFSSTVAAWFARRSGVPFVIRPLGTLTHYGVSRRRPALKRCSLALVEGPMLKAAAAVHFTSEMERGEAESLGIQMRSRVIPLAVESGPDPDLEGLLSSFPMLRGRRWVLYLSRLDPKKNVEALIGAAALCEGELPELRWLVAGSGDAEYVESLKSMAAASGVNHLLVWAGHLEGGRKGAALAHAEFFVLPSHSENFGIAAAEALHAGLPVVLGKGVALAQLAEDRKAGIMIDPNAGELAVAVHRLSSDNRFREAAAANARELARAEFSLEALGGRLAELYRDVIASREGARNVR